MDTILADLDFATAYLDDILIKSKNREYHAKLVIEVFKKKEFGFKLSMEKCEFFQSKIKYLGQVIDKKGRTPDPNQADTIKHMPAPTNVAALQSFLGLANYYNCYISNMHILRAPLNHLLKKDLKWNWTDECEKAFEKLKTALTSNLVLTHYNLNKQIYVASDASNFGLGAVIFHKEDGKLKPIQHVSRTLLPAEMNYSQIEKEGLVSSLQSRNFINTYTVENLYYKRTIVHC